MLIKNNKKQDFLRSVSETSENEYLFVFNSWLVSFGVCIYIQYFFGVVRNKFKTISVLKLIKRGSVVQENNMS